MQGEGNEEFPGASFFRPVLAETIIERHRPEGFSNFMVDTHKTLASSYGEPGAA